MKKKIKIIKKVKPKTTKKNTEIKNTNKKKRKLNLKTRNIILIGILSVLIFIVSVILIFFIYIIFSAPEFDTDILYKTQSSIFYDPSGNEIARVGYENREIISYDELPEVLIDAIIATEDSRFFQHNGFDIARFIKASFGQLTNQAGAGGASTITMQVVKNNFTNLNANGIEGIIRKFTDIYMSVFKVEKKYTKEEIIEFYVNIPWLGAGNTAGVEQASKLYFGKSVKDLSLPEAALIAGLFNNARLINPFYSIENATERRDTVLYLMYNHGYITEEQYEVATSIPVESLIVSEPDTGLSEYQSFIDTVVEEVIDDTGLNPYDVPMKITTTMDTDIQDVLIKLDTNDYFKYPDDVVQVGVAVTDTQNGAILGVFGGRNQTIARSFNRATGDDMVRHPGSTAKPIIDYGPYIEYNNGSPYTIFFDEPMTYSTGQSIKNADNKYLGMLSMRDALSKSRNIPALQAFQQLDTNKIADFTHSLGIDYGDYLYESASIGAFEGVNPLEMASAYAAFGNGGYYIEPYSYTKIEFIDSGEIIEQKPKKEKVMSEETAYMITSILMTAFNNHVGANFSISGTEIASKTGTSTYDTNKLEELGISLSASRDNWSNTYNKDYSISLWYGYDELDKDHYTMSIAGANATKTLMTGIGKRIYKKNTKFDKPSTVIEVEVEKESIPAMLPSEYTPESMRVTELFKAGTEPTEVSKRYIGLDNPASVESTVKDNIVTLKWQNISTPWAIDETSQQEYFNNLKTIFGDTKWVDNIITKYYNERINYNQANIGNVIYEIYEDDKLLGTSTTNSFTISNVTSGEHTYTVKSSYSIFKSNRSSGVQIKVKVGSSSIEEELNTIGNITLNDSDYTCLVTNSEFKDNGIKKVTDNKGNDITKDIAITTKIIYAKDGKEETVTKVDTSRQGTYKITYTVTYNGQTKTKSRTINISDICS